MPDWTPADDYTMTDEMDASFKGIAPMPLNRKHK